MTEKDENRIVVSEDKLLLREYHQLIFANFGKVAVARSAIQLIEDSAGQIRQYQPSAEKFGAAQGLRSWRDRASWRSSFTEPEDDFRSADRLVVDTRRRCRPSSDGEASSALEACRDWAIGAGSIVANAVESAPVQAVAR